LIGKVHDLNPTPQDLKPRVLATNIDFEDGTCSIELVQEVASQFGLHKVDADQMIADVARATQTWCEVAKTVGVRSADIKRMESAFEHDDLYRALRL